MDVKQGREVVRKEWKDKAEYDERNDRELIVSAQSFVLCKAVASGGKQEPEQVLSDEIYSKQLEE